MSVTALTREILSLGLLPVPLGQRTPPESGCSSTEFVDQGVTSGSGLDQADVGLPFLVVPLGFLLEFGKLPFAPDRIQEDQLFLLLLVLFVPEDAPRGACGVVGAGRIREGGIPRLDDGLAFRGFS